MPHGAPAAARAARWRVSQVSGTVMGCQVPSASSASRTTRVREATLAKAAFASAEPAGFPVRAWRGARRDARSGIQASERCDSCVRLVGNSPEEDRRVSGDALDDRPRRLAVLQEVVGDGEHHSQPGGGRRVEKRKPRSAAVEGGVPVVEPARVAVRRRLARAAGAPSSLSPRA